MALTKQEEELLESNSMLVKTGLRLSQINKEQNELLQDQLRSNTCLLIYCLEAYDIISQKENPTREEAEWLGKVRDDIKLRR